MTLLPVYTLSVYSSCILASVTVPLTLLTKAGNAALADEIARLKLLINSLEHSGTPPG